jgi:hypothetical protein
MEDTISDRDLEDLLSAERGYILRRAFLSPDEADQYRQESHLFLTTTRRVYRRIHRYAKKDYVWSTDRAIRPGDFTYRIYQSLRVRHSPDTERILQSALKLRNDIEAHWTHDAQYRATKAGLYDYVQVTTYGSRSEGIAKHCDFKGNTRYPLLQFLVLLSEPDQDYRGGALILYPRKGKPINIQKTLKLKKGDAFLFDKSLYHEVEATEPAPRAGVGRWTAVIGGRYPKPPTVADRTSRLVRGPVTAARNRLRLLLGMPAMARSGR